jgi:hypothetical protein
VRVYTNILLPAVHDRFSCLCRHDSDSSITTESSVRIATKGGIEQASKYPISYDSRLQNLTLPSSEWTQAATASK